MLFGLFSHKHKHYEPKPYESSDSVTLARHDERLKTLEKGTKGLNDRNHALSGKVHKHESKILFTQKSVDDLKTLINEHMAEVSKDFKGIRDSLSSIKTLKNKVLWGVFLITAFSHLAENGYFKILYNFIKKLI